MEVINWFRIFWKKKRDCPDFMRNWGNHLSVLFLLVEGS